MKNEQIKAEIEKVKANKFLPENIKNIKIAQLEKQLTADTDKEKRGVVSRKDRSFKVNDVVYNKKHNTIGIVRLEPEQGELKTDADGNVPLSDLEHYNRSDPDHRNAHVAPSTRKEIEKQQLATLEPDSSESEEEDLFEHPDKVPANIQKILEKLDGSLTQEKIGKLKKRLEKLGYTFDWGMDNEPYNLRKIEKRKAGQPKKPASEKKPKVKNTYKYKGKDIKDLDEKDCEELQKEVKERREKAKKSEKKSKSRPVIEKVAEPIIRGVKKAIENIPAADMKDAPKKELTRIDKAIAATKRFLMDLKVILGEDFEKDTIDDEMKELHALSKELHKKYGE